MVRCDIATLRSQRLSLDPAHAFAALASLGVRAEVELLDIVDKTSLLDAMRRFAEHRRTFDVVVILAHGDARGIQIASDLDTTWSGLAQYLKPLHARGLLLLACKGGKYDGVNALFRGVRTLRRVFASPIDLHKDAAALLLLFVPYLVTNRAPKRGDVSNAQLLFLVGLRCPVWQWMRDRDMNNPSGRVFDLVAELLDPLRS